MTKKPDPRGRDAWRDKLRGSENLDELAQLAETKAARDAVEDLKIERDVAEGDQAT